MDKNEYNDLVNFYKKSFEVYLDKTLNLSEVEQEFLKKVKYPISPSKEFIKNFNVESIWQIFYIKNNFFIERLNNEELVYLKKSYENQNLDENFYHFIKQTFPKVTKYYEKYPDEYYVHYPYTTEDTFVMNGSIFLIIIVDIFQNKTDDFKEFYFEIINKLSNLQEDLIKKGKEINLEVKYLYNN